MATASVISGGNLPRAAISKLKSEHEEYIETLDDIQDSIFEKLIKNFINGLGKKGQVALEAALGMKLVDCLKNVVTCGLSIGSKAFGMMSLSVAMLGIVAILPKVIIKALDGMSDSNFNNKIDFDSLSEENRGSITFLRAAANNLQKARISERDKKKKQGKALKTFFGGMFGLRNPKQISEEKSPEQTFA